jgi:hypothetical protein
MIRVILLQNVISYSICDGSAKRNGASNIVLAEMPGWLTISPHIKMPPINELNPVEKTKKDPADVIETDTWLQRASALFSIVFFRG